MSITYIVVVIYLLIGLFLSLIAVTATEFYDCSFISRVFMRFCLILSWPLCIVIYIDHIRKLKRNKTLNNVREVSKNIVSEHDEQLATFIDNLSKRYPEVSFAKLSRIAVAVSRWETKRTIKILEEERKRAERCKNLSDAEFSEYFKFWDGYGNCAEYLCNDFAALKTKLARYEYNDQKRNHQDRK